MNAKPFGTTQGLRTRASRAVGYIGAAGLWLTAPHQWRRKLRVALTVVAIALVLVFVFAPTSAPKVDDFCESHKVGCSLVTGFVSTGVVILLGYLVLFVWTLRRALRYYSDLARTTPERLMPTSPKVRAQAIRGRERLTATVAVESSFSRSGAPILVVGDPGAGRTTFLLALAQRLAEGGSVPVVVSLRGATRPVSFRKLAEQELVRRIDPVVRAEADAQRVWRQLCADGRIVVLADSLDDIALGSPAHERDHAIRGALVTARDDRIAVVATARPEVVPFGAPGAQFELGPLAQEDAVAYIEERVKRPEREGARLQALIDAGEVTRSPLYLNIIAALYRADPRLLPEAGGSSRDVFLVELLDSWLDLVEQRTVLPEVELEQQQRRRIVDGLSSVAYAMTCESSAELRISALAASLGDGMDVSSLIEGASQLELIDTFVVDDKDISVRFSHAIMQSYFTSRYLRERRGSLKALLERTGSESVDSVLMAAAPATKSRTAAADAFLERAKELVDEDDDSALAFNLAAQELAPTGSGLQKRAAAATEAVWSRASPRARLAAVRRLDGRDGEWSFRVLYRATSDPSYRVRWDAARAIAAGGSAAYKPLCDEFSATVETAYARDWHAWTDEAALEISVLGWIAPALAATVDDADRSALEQQLDRLTALVRENRLPHGTEASLAQGFKLAAERSPTSWPAERARVLIGNSSFWYSRICLLHALCIAAVENRDVRRDAVAALEERLRKPDEHPFVREAGRLCLRAIKTGDWRPFVWGDESALVGRSASTLADPTAVLVADVVVLLNLTEYGDDKDEIEERKERTYGMNVLPYCLSTSRDRSEQLFTSCVNEPGCEFRLCPYPLRAEQAIARGEFSQAFCEHQLELVTRRPRLLRRGKRPGWWSHTTRSARRGFWQRMENRVL